MVIVYFLILLFSLYLYFNEKHEYVLLCFTIVLTSGYSILPQIEVKSYDLVTPFIVFISISEWGKNSRYFKVNEPQSIIVATIIVYQIFEFLITIVFKYDTPLWAIKVARMNLVYLVFFYFRKISTDKLIFFLKYNMYLCMIQGVFYYLQLLGVEGILRGRIDEAIAANQVSRYLNYPQFFAAFYFLYSFFIFIKTKVEGAFMLLFWGGMFVVGQSRGIIIASIFTICIWLFYKRQIKNIPVVIIGLSIAYFAFLPVFQYRDQHSSSRSTYADIMSVLTLQDYRNVDVSSGNMSFKIGMAIERFDYLINNPQYLLTGVGDIHEDSPNCRKRFHFFLGTHNEECYYGIGMINSGDITWTPTILRYGLIGLVLYISFLAIWITKALRKSKIVHDPMSWAALLMSLYVTVYSINMMLFDAFYTMFFTLIFYRFSLSENHQTELPLLQEKRREIP